MPSLKVEKQIVLNSVEKGNVEYFDVKFVDKNQLILRIGDDLYIVNWVDFESFLGYLKIARGLVRD